MGAVRRLITQRHSKLKPLLMDQKFLAGIGNIYSDEILWGAGLKWDRESDSLSAQEVRRLYRAMVETLQDAVKYRGSSLADEQYVDLYGKPGEFQHHHNVYARDGEACRRCRHSIVRDPLRRSLDVLLRGMPSLTRDGSCGGTCGSRDACRVCGSASRVGPRPTRLGVTGWVRNRDDGRVEAVFEGPDAAVDRIVAWCHDGPRSAVVEAVEVAVEPVVGEAGFSVR